jgi:hypothetical protein
MTYPQPRTMNLAVGRVYRFDTQSEVDDVLCYEGPRPLRVGDLAYCERKIGNVGFQLSLVKRSANGQIRRVPRSQFAVDGGLREIGKLAPGDSLDYENGKSVTFSVQLPTLAEAEDPTVRLREVEPGDVLQLAEEGRSLRYAFVLKNPGGPNPRLRLATRSDDGQLQRLSSTIAELQSATVFADASIDQFQEGPLYILETLRPGTILHFKDPLKMPLFGNEVADGGQFALLERTTHHRSKAGVRFHLLVKAPNGELVKKFVYRNFFKSLGMAVVGVGDRGPLNLG